MKLALDQSSDRSHKELYSLLNGINLPSFVKDAELDDPEMLQYFEKDAFADDYSRSFPINSPARVYVSNAYFLSKKAQMVKRWGKSYITHVEDRIKKAADIFGVTGDLKEYEKQASERTDRGYTEEPIYTMEIAGTSYNLFPVKTAEEFTKVANTFSNNISKFPFQERQKIAQAFVAKASKYGVDELPELVCKYAGMYYPDVGELKAKLWHRATKVASPELRAKYESLIEAVPALDSKEDVFKLAQIVDHFERQSNIKVAQVLGDPVDQFFTLSVEKVAEILNVVTMGGEAYAVKDLTKVSGEIFKEAFGIDIDPHNVDQLRDVLPTMPLSDISLFKELSGISPI